MDFRFDAMLCSNLGKENSDADRIKSSRGAHLAHGPQVPHPDLNQREPFNSFICACCIALPVILC